MPFASRRIGSSDSKPKNLPERNGSFSFLPVSRPTMTSSPSSSQNKKPLYKSMSFQVLLTVGLAIVLGYVNPPLGVAMKPLGDAFIRLITMIITLIIFCTVVTGIAGMEDLKKVGRVGG